MPSRWSPVRDSRGAAYDPYVLMQAHWGPLAGLRAWLAHRLTHAYVVSFPKSGRTWLRMLLATYFHHAYGVRRVPVTTEQWRENWRVPVIRFTHMGSDRGDPLDQGFDFRRHADRKVVYLVRDPRDVLTSYYFHVTRRWKRVPAHLVELSGFIRDERYGLPRIVAFMNRVAACREQVPRHRVVHYEDLHRDARKEVSELLAFLGVEPVSEDLVERSAEACQFSRLRELEKQGSIADEMLRPGRPDDPQSFKVREGRVGGHRHHLSEADRAWVDAFVHEHLDPLFPIYR